MRGFMIIVVLVGGILAAAPAHAADPPSARSDVFTHRVPYGQRVGPIVIYDFQPGVVIRAYWASPWRHRHYFPFGAKQDAEDEAPQNRPPQPAETFERSWSTCHMCDRELPLRARGEATEDPLPTPPKK
jgi:hypothetical protein